MRTSCYTLHVQWLTSRKVREGKMIFSPLPHCINTNNSEKMKKKKEKKEKKNQQNSKGGGKCWSFVS